MGTRFRGAARRHNCALREELATATSLADERHEAGVLPERVEIRVDRGAGSELRVELERPGDVRQRLLGLAGERLEAREVVQQYRVVAVRVQLGPEERCSFGVPARFLQPASPT